MRFRCAVILLLTLLLAACKRESYSRSSSGFSSLDQMLLYDFRAHQPGMGARLDPATARKVLSAVFPSNLPSCLSAGAGQSGQVLPAIRDAANGSFTAAGLKQTVYLIDAGQCVPGASPHRLAVFTAGRLTADVEAPMGGAILRTYDLDRNGKNELLLQEAQSGRGGLAQAATLLEFEKDNLAVVEDFGQVYRDPCAIDVPTKSISAGVVYYLPPPPGQKPRFTVELYRAPCPPNGQEPHWSRVTDR